MSGWRAILACVVAGLAVGSAIGGLLSVFEHAGRNETCRAVNRALEKTKQVDALEVLRSVDLCQTK